jgi:opacity protein-like surface antigen
MKVLCLVVVLSFASLFAHVAAADSIDPRIAFGGSGSISASCPTYDDSSACDMTGSTLTITATLSNDETGGTVDLYDGTGADLTSLTITDTDLPVGEILSCGAPTEYFTTVTQTGPDSCTFSGMSDALPAGSTGGIILSDFDANSTIDLLVTTPEPSSMLLLGMGLLSVFATRKWRGTARLEA